MKTRLRYPGIVVLWVAAVGFSCALPSAADYDLMSASGVWLLDAGEGEVAKDTGVNGNDGTFFHDPAWVDGRFGKALAFEDESADFVWVRDAVGLPVGTSPRTIMCQFKWAEVNWDRNSVLVSLGPSNWRQVVTVGLYTDMGPGVYTIDDVEYFEWDGDTEWHHIAVVFPDGAKQSNEFLLYLDGAPQVTRMDADVNGISSVGGQATIGCMSGALNDFFHGIIDEVAIFPFAMPAEDIASAAVSGLVGGQLAVSPGGKLAASWGALKDR